MAGQALRGARAPVVAVGRSCGEEGKVGSILVCATVPGVVPLWRLSALSHTGTKGLT